MSTLSREETGLDRPEFQPTLPNPEDMFEDALEEYLEESNAAKQAGPSKMKVRKDPTGRSGNTGPKGVKEDFEEAKLKMRARRLEKKLEAERAIQRAAVGDEKFVLAAPIVSNRRDGSDNDLETDESDDEAFQAYRLQRISNMTKAAVQPLDARLIFGKLDEVTLDNYLEEVEEVDNPHWIVVHLYEPYIEVCVRMNFALMNLAEQFPHVRFVRGRASDLLPGYDEYGLSTLILYKAGEQKHVLVRVQDSIGTNFLDRDVVSLLVKYEF